MGVPQRPLHACAIIREPNACSLDLNNTPSRARAGACEREVRRVCVQRQIGKLLMKQSAQ